MTLCHGMSQLGHLPVSTVEPKATLLYPTLQFKNLQEKQLVVTVPLLSLQCSRGLQLCLKPGQHSLHCFGIPKVINSIQILETIPCLEKNGKWCVIK